MPVKTKTNSKQTPSPTSIGPILKYLPVHGGWGIEALYEGYRLVFSGEFSKKRFRAEKFLKIMKFFDPSYHKNPGSIIRNVDLYNLFSDSARRAWNQAFKFAKKRGSKEVGVEDIFLALLREPSVINLLSRLKVDGNQAEIFITNYLQLTKSLEGDVVKKIPFEAFALAVKLHNHKIGSLMLLGGLLKSTPHDNILQAIFTNIGLNAAKLELFAVWLLDLDHEFATNTTSDKLVFCLRQAGGLEQQFGYFFQLPAIETAVELSGGQTLKDLQHLKALQYLVKAGLLAKQSGTKVISENFVKQAAGK